MIDHHRHRWVSVTTVLAVLLSMLVLPNVSAVQAELPPEPSQFTVTTQNLAEDEQLVRESLQHPIQDEVFYFVLPDRFENADTSNDFGDDPGGSTDEDILRHGFFPENHGYYHGGDFAGLRSQLDYLEDMGVTAIWMTPIFKNRPVQGDGTIANSSSGYHGYWITDFTQVDPHLGTNAELVALIDDAQSRDMKVFFDIITNHTADVISYESGEFTYRNKTDYPFRDADGNVFDDRDFAGTDTFPELDAETSFAQVPVFRSPEDATVKQPEWLNNRIYYHNRGDSTFAGESSLYGDFFGLDDLFTSHPDVVDGMIDIYKYWISEFGIDGFRIDTVKHVNIEFWQRFGPEIMAHAQSEGKDDFFMYGEVFSGDVTELSQFSTEGRLPAVLDFAFQGNTRAFASQSAPTNNLRNFFEADDYYTDADSNAYSLPTFIGNHDMGRFGLFLNQDNPDASDAELLARSQLAHALMFFARGMPVIYYGDEQGFTGDGGDKDARENMFPSVVDTYNDNDLIGTDATTAESNFDATHPIYQKIGALSEVFSDHTALRRGAQIHRYSTDQAGIYAFSRIDRDEKVEYVVVLNNAETEQTATFATYLPNTDFTAVYPTNNATLTASANAEITVTVPALSVAVYQADSALPASDAAPGIAMRAPQQDEEVVGRFEVGADLDADVFAEVTFAVKVGDEEEYTVVGTDNNAPYRVFYDASDLDVGTPLTFKAIANDLSGNLNSTMVGAVVGEDNNGGGGVCPAVAYAVIHYNRPNGDYEGWGLHLWGDAIAPSEVTEWANPKPFEGEDEYGVFAFIKLQDATQPVNFIIHKGDEKDTPEDRSFVPAESPEIWVASGDATNYTSAAEAQGFTTIRYNRPDGDYEGWGLHLWGDGLDPSEVTEWADPKLPDGFDDYGAYFNIQLQDATQPVNFIIHKGDEKDTPDDRIFVPVDSATLWLQQGDATNYTSQGAAENYAIIHYHRPDGDYGDFESDNFADYWGLHVWAGAAEPTEWNTPIKPAGTDRFGVYYQVPLADAAATLSYILHRGDEKDLPDDQELNITTYGNEVWALQGTPEYLLPTLKCDEPLVCKADYEYAIIHYNRPDGDYEGWGLHLWGDAIDPAEVTEWADPKPFEGEDEFGVFAFIKLQDATQPVNFIIHKGDEKDTPEDRSFVPADGPQIWVQSGDATNYTSAAEAQGFVTIRYNRPEGDYGSVADNDYWGLHLWGDAIADGVATEWSEPRQPDGFDDYGAYFNVPIKDASQPVNFIVHTPSGDTVPDTREPGGDRSFVPNDTAGIWLQQGDEAVYTTRGAAEGLAIIHYHRPDGDYGDFESDNFADFWGLHVWTGAAEPTEWNQPVKPAGTDRFGIYFEVPLADEATALSYILHRGDEKDLPEDQELNLETYGNEIWVIQATPTYLLPIVSDCEVGQGDLSKQRAHWVSDDTIAWPIEGGAANSYALHYDPDGAMAIEEGVLAGGSSVELTYDAAGLSNELREQFPHLADFTALKIDAADLDKIPDILKGQIAVSATNSSGVLVDATSLQIPGVLDTLYTYDGELGAIYAGGIPTLKVWAPTARSVKLHIFADTNPDTTSTVYEMDGDAENGVWSITGDTDWDGKYYLYEVEVYVPSTGQVEQNIVTDPYAVSLSMNSTRSQIVDLSDASLKPRGWDRVRKPTLEAPEDIVLYELHVRDFSINDETVPEAYRGTFKAFTQRSNGMRHLQALSRAGLTHIHLLPTFDIATIDEDKSTWETPDYDLLETYPPDSEEQQRATEEVRNQDGFNWGYDPFHYNVPEGSYSTNPDGPTRVVEFREMVSSLNRTGLRVVLDVVYNHTNASGQGERSVLDKVVPGYYHRLDQDGNVTKSTCCENTATEHAMMEKLMIDSVVLWATAYKVDGFRFDLMGHHMKDDMIKVREALDALTIEEHGVDGKSVYVYGEGWNFGEVENNQRGVNATQLNMGGTGIGVFNDRLRDAVRGGGPFSGLQEQGFATGLYYDPNATDQGTPDAQRNLLLQHMDRIKVGLTGNLSMYELVDRNGNLVTGADVDYNGSPAGYTSDPQEDITYIAAHDNETFFDALQLKAPMDLPMEDRVRMQNLGISIVMLGQGVPFFHAGQDMLRSKSLDRNSYDSGDWFNRMDFTYESNNWGVGLPPGENSPNWPVMQPILANPALKPDRADILTNATHFREMLLLRKSSPLFRLRTAEDVQQRVMFLGDGPDQTPGLIVMSLDDTVGDNLDRQFSRMIVVFNASNTEQQFTDESLQGQGFALHPLQRRSADQIVRTSTFDRTSGTFTVPARTTAVFVAK